MANQNNSVLLLSGEERRERGFLRCTAAGARLDLQPICCENVTLRNNIGLLDNRYHAEIKLIILPRLVGRAFEGLPRAWLKSIKVSPQNLLFSS